MFRKEQWRKRSAKTFPVKRFGVAINEVPLRNTLDTGIEFEHLPGHIPVFLEVEACIANNYRYFHDWQELEEKQKAFLIGQFISKRWVDSHRSDAEYREMEKASRRKK